MQVVLQQFARSNLKAYIIHQLRPLQGAHFFREMRMRIFSNTFAQSKTEPQTRDTYLNFKTLYLNPRGEAPETCRRTGLTPFGPARK